MRGPRQGGNESPMGLEAELRAPSADTYEAFVRAWHEDELKELGPSEPPSGLPARLRRFYETFGKHDTVNLHLLPPATLEPAENPMLFAVEEQGVFAYAVGHEEDDPPVFGTWDVETPRWEREGERLGRFLLQYALYETALASRHGGWGWVDATLRPRLDELLPTLPLAPWTRPAPCSFRARLGIVAIAFDRDEPIELHAGACADVALELLDEVVEWDVATHRDSDAPEPEATAPPT
jgi:hypothetical protein